MRDIQPTLGRSFAVVFAALIAACASSVLKAAPPADSPSATRSKTGAWEQSPESRTRPAPKNAAPDSGKLSQTAKGLSVASPRDQQLQKTLRRFLQDDPRTRPFADRAVVQNGRAILTGRTYLNSSRQLAETTAAGVRGIVDVQNLIVVEPSTDLEIARQLHEAFSRDEVVDDASIGVTVFHGKVYLSGTADSSEELARVNQIVYSIPGVAAVSNALQVSPGSKYPPPRTPVGGRAYSSTRAGYR